MPNWAWAAGFLVVVGGGAAALFGLRGDESREAPGGSPAALGPGGASLAQDSTVPGDTGALAFPDTAGGAGDTSIADTLPQISPPIPDPVRPLDTSLRVPAPVRLPPGVAGPVVVVRDLPLDSIVESGAGPSRTVRVIQTLASGESLELTITPFTGADTAGISPPSVTSVGDLSAGTVRAGAWMVNARARVPLDELQAALRRLVILRP